MKNGKEKGGKFIKKGEKALKNFWAINSASPRPPQLICRRKKLIPKEGGGGNDQNAKYISLV